MSMIVMADDGDCMVMEWRAAAMKTMVVVKDRSIERTFTMSLLICMMMAWVVMSMMILMTILMSRLQHEVR